MMQRKGAPPPHQYISGERPTATMPQTSGTPEDQDLPNAYDVFVAAQTRFNFLAAGVDEHLRNAGPTWADVGHPELDPKDMDWADYSPFDEGEVEKIEGYPPELFVQSRNPHQTRQIMREYDVDKQRRDTLDRASDGYEIINMVGAGLANPLSLIPLMGFSGANSRAAMNFLKGSATVGGVEALNEYLLHQTDMTRKAEESANYILGASLFGGVAGSLLGRSTKYADEVIAAEKKVIQETNEVNRPAINPDRVVVRGEDGKFKSVPRKLAERDTPDQITGFIPKLAAHLTPIRTMASENPLARTLAGLMGEQSVVGSTRASIETLLSYMDRDLAGGIRAARRGYRDYVKATGDKSMSYRRWQNEIAHALRNGDESPIVEVQKAAKAYRKILDGLKNRAVKSGLLTSEETLTKFAKSYFPRVYNMGKINAEPERFVQKIADYIQNTNPKVTAEEAFDAAQQVYGTLSTTHYQVGFHKGTNLKTGPLKNRTLAIPDNVLEEFLINEPEAIIRQYSRHVGSRVLMSERFGDDTLKDQIKEVDDWWAKHILERSKAGASDREMTRLRRHRDRDKLDLEIMRDRLLNRYGMPEDPGGMFIRAGRAARNLNAVRLLGGMTLSALPDLARPLWKHGLGAYGRAMKAVLTDPAFRNMSKADLQRMGVGLDLVLDQRLRSIAELDYNPFGVSKFERGLEAITQGTGHAGKLRHGEGIPDMGRASGMSYWNASLKMLSGVMSQDGFLMKVMQPGKYADDLARGGIDGQMARRIREQYKKYGSTDNNLRLGNSDQWDDHLAAQAFQTAILKEVDSTIVTPGIMDRPRWMSSEMGKVIGQVKSFAFASTNRQLLAGMAQKDMRIAQGVLASTMMGMMSLYVKGLIAGKTVEEITGQDPMEFAWQGAIHSGSVGIGSELASIAQTATADNANAYSVANKLTNVALGPSFSLGRDVVGAAYGDEAAVRRLIPYNNLFYLRNHVFDPMQEFVEEAGE